MNQPTKGYPPMRVWDESHDRFVDYRLIPMQQGDPASPYSVNLNTGLLDLNKRPIYEFDLVVDRYDDIDGVCDVKCVCCKAEG